MIYFMHKALGLRPMRPNHNKLRFIFLRERERSYLPLSMQVDRPFFSSLLIQQAKNLENHLIMLSSLPIDRSNEINFTNPYKNKSEKKRKENSTNTPYMGNEHQRNQQACASQTPKGKIYGNINRQFFTSISQ